ncbi:histidine kinase [Paludibaculum fermentans]|uniref:Histidine kinase n=1 Tax=Paludibaculum fermentans TaxID=1473598 RepID=A0A7S7NNQ0_PALFE|nr:histidine kinase [Paludibaculum fermentans]QOY86929.1 histidine kinase [Paludibaculum fermentans]
MTEPSPRPAGRLKIILGYAAGVGKTFKMLEEGQQLRKEGHDVVVGYFEPHGRQDTIAKLEGLELVPRRNIEYRGRVFEEMDTPAILARRPEICLVDEFPHTNVPGVERGKRWEDVMVLLEAGIDVFTTMNIQHLESLNDQMREITGIQVRETIPDWVVKQAAELVLVDVPPTALLNRLQRGVVYAPDKAQRAIKNFFKEPALAALRELAMRQAAHEVDIRQSEIELPVHPAHHAVNGGTAAPREKILIHISEAPTTAALIRRGRRVADYLQADCFAVCILPVADLRQLPAPARLAMEEHLEFARKLRVETRVLEGEDPAEALVEFARRNGVTQIFLSKPAKRLVGLVVLRDFVMKVVRLASDMQVTVVAERASRTN